MNFYYRLGLLVALEIILTVVAAIVVKHSIAGALKAIKLALKSEFTTNVGRLNLVSMILIVFLIIVFNLHEMIATALSVESPSPTQHDHVLGPVALVGFYFIGSLICVIVVEKK